HQSSLFRVSAVHVLPTISLASLSLLSLTRPSPRSTLFPYTTLFRSAAGFSVRMPPMRTLRSCAPASCTLSSSFVHAAPTIRKHRSEEHTSELQSRFDLVCRLLLEKKILALLQHGQQII